jgi:succinoglycan biosynthesis protein ExoV
MVLRFFRPESKPGVPPYSNFGDELNPWLWPRLLPDAFDDVADVSFFGIGSLLGTPKHDDATMRHKIIFGAGAGQADAARREPADGRWTFYCVRGPLTARAYGLNPDLAVADPALLLTLLYKPASARTHGVAFMPHIAQALAWENLLRDACRRANVRFIDPREPVDDILDKISSSGMLLAEAMHSAIAADALRVPWIPVYTTPRTHVFKWRDWCESMALPFRPRRLLNLSNLATRFGLPRSQGLTRLGAAALGHMLARCARRQQPFLSEESIHAKQLARLQDRVEVFRQDVAVGQFR